MKIWELCNKVKGTNATKETIANWAYMNRICPLSFDVGLDINIEIDDDRYPKDNVFVNTARKICNNNECGTECLMQYLDMEVNEDEINFN